MWHYALIISLVMSQPTHNREFSIVRDDGHVTPSLHLCTCNCPPATLHVHRWSDGVTCLFARAIENSLTSQLLSLITSQLLTHNVAKEISVITSQLLTHNVTTNFSFITLHSLPNCVATVIIHLCPRIILFFRHFSCFVT